MRIILSVPGHLRTVPMNEYIFRTLIGMGHEVRVLNYGSNGLFPRLLKGLSKSAFQAYIEKKLLRMAEKFRPDLFLTVFGFDHRREAIEALRAKNIKTACWWLNDPFQFERSIANASAYDYYFTNSEGIINEYKKAGIKNVFFLPLGCFPDVHKKIDSEPKKYDVAFAGDWGPLREEILTGLAKEFEVAIFGPWGKKLGKGSPLRRCLVRDGFFTPGEMVRIFNASKVVINIHSWFGKWDYGINPRVFEASGSGAFQLCDWKEEIPSLYAEDKEIALYKSVEELKDKLRYFLNDDKERSETALKAYARTHGEHTYEERLKKMLSICGLN